MTVLKVGPEGALPLVDFYRCPTFPQSRRLFVASPVALPAPTATNRTSGRRYRGPTTGRPVAFCALRAKLVPGRPSTEEARKNHKW